MCAQRRYDATTAVRRASGVLTSNHAAFAAAGAGWSVAANTKLVASSRRRANASSSLRAFAPSRDENK